MNEVSNSLVCICIRNGVEIWVEQERAQNLVAMFTAPNPPQFVAYEGRLINRADLVGIFNPSDMEEHTRRKNGEWKCKRGTWHPRNRECECRTPLEEWRPPAD